MKNKLKNAITGLLLLSIPQISFAQSPDLGSVESFAVFTSVGAFNSLGTTSITGDIGTGAGAFTGFPPGVVFGAIQNENAVSAQAALDLVDANADLTAISCGTVLTVTIGGGQTLTPDIYCTGAAATLTGEVILDGEGDPNALFVIRIDGAFSAANFSSVTLMNGASLCNVYWQINGAVEIGDNSVFRGTIIANGAITLLSTASLYGRALSLSGAISLNSNLIETTSGDIYFADTDGDTYGDPANTMSGCSMPAGFVNNDMDCDDTNAAIHPLATEICNMLDDDCNGMTDDLLMNASIYPTDTAFSCKGTDLVFNTDSCLGCTYQWYKNDNVIIGATNSTYANNKPAYYSVEVTVPGGCSVTSEHTLLHIAYNPNANIYEPNGLNICAPTPGTNIILKASYLETNTYQWYRNGTPYMGVGANSWRIFPDVSGIYYCSITTNEGCTRNTPFRNVVNACRTADVAENSVELYPNPASNLITISMNNLVVDAEINIQILSLLGEVIYNNGITTYNNGSDIQIPVDFLAPGMYTVNILVANEIYTKSFIKQ